MPGQLQDTDDGEQRNDGAAGNALNTSQAVLQYFWDLASYDEAARVAAARGLVTDLVADQAKHAATLENDTDATPEDGAPKIQQLEYYLRRCSPTMVYALRRLARGLTSSRAGARQGYATAMAGLLAATAGAGPGGGPLLGPQGVLVLLDVCLDGPVRGGDAKDTLLGRLFGLGALLRSGLDMDAAMMQRVLGSVLDAGQRKSFLREAAAATALEAAARMDRTAVAAAAAEGQPLAAILTAPLAEATPEALLLALVLWPKLPPATLRACKLLPANTPPPPSELFLHNTAPSPAVAAAAAATAAGFFSSAHLKAIQPLLLATSAAHPRMHTLWQYLLPLLLPGFVPYRHLDSEGGDAATAAAGQEAADADDGADAPGSGSSKKGKKGDKEKEGKRAAKAAADAGKGAVARQQLEAFWGGVVEGGLMDSSHERRYLGFQLFSRLLPHLRPEHVQIVFSPNFTRTLTNNAARNNSYLHASARKLVDNISAFLERSGRDGGADESAKLAVAATLQRLGGMAHRELAAGKLTQKLVQGMDAAGVHRYVCSLQAAFLAGRPPLQPGAGAEGEQQHEQEDEQDAEQVAAERRAQCVEQLLSVLKFPAAAEQDGAAALRFLATAAFVGVDPKQQAKAAKSKIPEVAQAATQLCPALQPATRGLCASRLVTLLAHMSHGVQAKVRASQQQQGKGQKGAAGEEGAAAPAAKKRKTGAGEAVPAEEATAVAAAPPPSAVNQHLHDTVSYIRKATAAAGCGPAAELGEEGETAMELLTAIETTALSRLEAIDGGASGEQQQQQLKGQKGKKGGKGEAEEEDEEAGGEPGQQQAPALRALAALAAHLQLALLSEPRSFEMDLPLSLRRVAAEGLGLEGLPEVEEEVEEGDAPKEQGSWSEVLVDLLLALLARPGGALPVAPLRDAAELLWRQCCQALGKEGLEDVVRVVAAGDKGAGQDAAGLFESDDEEEEEEEEGGSEEEDEEEEEEEEQQEGKQQQKKDAAAAKKRKGGSDAEDEEGSDDDGQGKGGDGDGSDDGSDDEGMDDEAMFRMDDKLAAYFKSMVGGRAGGQAAAERAAALLNFRLRALALIEMYAKKVPNSPLLLLALAPLLRALSSASRPGGQQQLADRLRGVLTNKLCKRCTLDVAVLGGVEGYSGLLKRLLYEASRNRTKAVAAVAAGAFTAAVRAGQAAQEAEVASTATSSFRAALSDFLTKKKSRLQPSALAAAFRAAPAAALPSLDLLLGHVASGRNAHVRVAAAELVADVIKSKPDGLAAALGGGAGAPKDKKGGKKEEAKAEGKGEEKQQQHALGGALGAALAACAAGVGLKREQHAKAVKAAAAAAEALRRLLPERRAAEVLGSDKMNAVAKAVVTVQKSPGGVSGKVDKPLKRLVTALGLEPLLAKTQPDPALAAKMAKAQQQLQQQLQQKGQEQKQGKGKEGGKAAAANGGVVAGAKDKKGKGEQGQEGKGKVGAKEEEKKGKDKKRGKEEEDEEEDEMEVGTEEEEGGPSDGAESDGEEGDSEGPSGSGSEGVEEAGSDGSGSEDGEGDSDEEEEGAGRGGRGGRGGKRGRGGRGAGGRGRGGRGRGGAVKKARR